LNEAVLGTAIILLGLVLWGTLRQRARERAQARFDRVVADYLPVLRRKQRQLVRVDDYGVVDRSRWERELGYVIDRVVLPALAERDAALVREGLDRYRERLEAAVAADRPDPAAEARFERVRTGREFEEFCAQELQRAGWRVTLTAASRDQGADLIVERGGERLAVQCKLLGRPVGNHAVQEVVAARAHRQADRALVVSNQRFTASCIELASTNRVELLHWSELARL
jgi:restriction system protein